MTNRELEHQLYSAIDHSAPNDIESVLSRCETRKGNVMAITTEKKARTWRNLVAACLALVLLLGGAAFYHQNGAVASVVSIDVNPSIELRVNKHNTILSCTPLNDEAHEILSDMSDGADLKGATLKVGVNAIIGSLVRHGYLDSISSAILLSVEDRNASRAETLQQELSGIVDTVLTEQSAQATILSQTVPQEPQLEALTRENSLSIGKANLIQQVMEMRGVDNASNETDLQRLSSLSVEELYDLLTAKEIRLPIGKDAAYRAAATYADVLTLSHIGFEVDAELDETPAHYEVELESIGRSCTYIIDAFTGEVLRGAKDFFAAASTQDPSSVKTPGDISTPEHNIREAEEIGLSQAKSIALAHAGLDETQVSRLKTERDLDNGRLEYEVEFRSGGMEYEYTIDAYSGTILEFDQENDDD